MRTVFIIILILFLAPVLRGQDEPVITTGTTVDGDTMPELFIEEVEIYRHPTFKKKRSARKYGRTIRNVQKVYPYAQLVHEKLDEINANLDKYDSEKEQKKYIKKVQKEMMDQFEGEVRHMTWTQGKILVKLIDRETGSTSYYWLQEMRGEFFAGFWQTVARIFGNDLKAEYDPKDKDRYIEHIVRMIELGLIPIES